jgi:hypothetical protein
VAGYGTRWVNNMVFPVLISGSYKSKPLWLMVAIALTSLALAGLWQWFLVGFGSGAVLAGLLALLTWRKRRWLQADDDGFWLTDWSGKRRVTDDQVQELGIGLRSRFVGGLPTSSICQGVFTIGPGRARRIPFSCTVALDGHDSLLTFFERLQTKLFSRREQALQGGGHVLGNGWELSEHGLRVAGGADLVRMCDITAASVIEAELRIWRGAESEPFFRIAEHSVNAWLLARYVQQAIARQASHTQLPGKTGALGRVLFERGAPASVRWLTLVLGVMLSLLGAGSWLAGVLVGGAFSLLGGLLLMSAWGSWRFRFRCHELGVANKTWRTTHELRYEDVGSFTFAAVRNFVNGIYHGTELNMQFVPRAGCGKRRVDYSAVVRGIDQELDGIRDHISRVIATSMARALAEGQEVRWTKSLAFVPGALLYSAPGLFGRKEPQRIPLTGIILMPLHEGRLYLSVGGQAIEESCTAANFFPGYYLLSQLVHDRARTCRACGGTGTHSIELANKGGGWLVTCPACNGTGATQGTSAAV